jgi:hypothetical protein
MLLFLLHLHQLLLIIENFLWIARDARVGLSR